MTQNAYATGGSTTWFDAISANFDLAAAGIDIGSIESAQLRFYTRNGTSGGWVGNYHYQVLQGAFNPTNQDANPLGTPFNLPAGDWIIEPLDVSWFTPNSFDVTIRLWEAQVDAIELQVTLIPAPEPSSLLLLGTGAFGLARFAQRRKRQA